jgi:hypothetical protein
MNSRLAVFPPHPNPGPKKLKRKMEILIAEVFK